MNTWVRLISTLIGRHLLDVMLDNRHVRNAGTLLLFVSIGYLVFLPSFANLDFFWDDEVFIFSNPYVLNAPSLLSFWDSGSKFSKAWPLSYSFYWYVIHNFPSLSLGFYKSVNIFIHSLNGFVLFCILRSLNLRPSFLLSMIFMAHPLHVEVVSWVMQFQTILAGFFGLLAVYFFLMFCRKKGNRYWLTALTLFFLSLQAKSIAVALPLLFAYMLWFWHRPLRSYLLLIPFLLLSGHATLVSVKGTNFHLEKSKSELIETGNATSVSDRRLAHVRRKPKDISSDQASAHEAFFEFNNYYWKAGRPKRMIEFSRTEVLRKAIVHYPLKIVFPVGLGFIYPKTVESLVLVAIMVALIFGLPLYLYIQSRQRIVFTVPVILSATLLPFCGLSYIGFFSWSLVADRYAYLAVLALPLSFGIGLRKLREFPSVLKVYLALILCLSHWYGYKFNNPLRLYEAALEHRADPAIYSLYFEQHLRQNLIIEAEEVLNEASRKFPDHQKFKFDRIRLEMHMKHLKGSN